MDPFDQKSRLGIRVIQLIFIDMLSDYCASSKRRFVAMVVPSQHILYIMNGGTYSLKLTTNDVFEDYSISYGYV